jgi:hypothetical protein
MNARVPTSQTGDELDELVILFNSMLEKIEVLIDGSAALWIMSPTTSVHRSRDSGAQPKLLCGPIGIYGTVCIVAIKAARKEDSVWG